MLYDDKPLQQEGIKVSKWTGSWNQKDMQKYDQSSTPVQRHKEACFTLSVLQCFFDLVVFHNSFCLNRGPGVLLEGVYQKRVKHTVQDTGGKKVRNGIVAHGHFSEVFL